VIVTKFDAINFLANAKKCATFDGGRFGKFNKSNTWELILRSHLCKDCQSSFQECSIIVMEYSYFLNSDVEMMEHTYVKYAILI
jgi:hypothetical protein